MEDKIHLLYGKSIRLISALNSIDVVCYEQNPCLSNAHQLAREIRDELAPSVFFTDSKAEAEIEIENKIDDERFYTISATTNDPALAYAIAEMIAKK